MNLLTTMTMTFGVVLSALSGMICYVGSHSMSGALDSIPNSWVLLAHPQAVLLGGLGMIMFGVLCQPSAAE